MSGRNKGMADGFRECLKSCLSSAMEKSCCVWVEAEEEDCPGKMAGGKVPAVQPRDENRRFHPVCMAQPGRWAMPTAGGGCVQSFPMS